jgi:hypothetical protein
MAAGYMHTSTIDALLAGGADPEQADRQGRSPLELVESLRAALPAADPRVVPRRIALEEVLKTLTGAGVIMFLCIIIHSAVFYSVLSSRQLNRPFSKRRQSV